MIKNSPRKFWPYDEVQIERDSAITNRFVMRTPWLLHSFSVDLQFLERVEGVVQKLQTGQAGADNFDDVSWLFQAVDQYPLAYILPRQHFLGQDQHGTTNPLPASLTPSGLLKAILKDFPHELEVQAIAQQLSAVTWSWSDEDVNAFSKTAKGHDPESVFSVVRRFHLLNDLENNQTARLLAFIGSLDQKSERFKAANAFVIRQNHYITLICGPVLSASFEVAQSARAEVSDFIDAESGHDKILAVALKALGHSTEEIPVLDCVKVLMELFKSIAKRNFLAFAMVVDVFERSSYLDEDPLSQVLKRGGEEKAAYQLNVHRNINEQGGHENVALGFLAHMSEVQSDYVTEAVRLAELLTLVIHRVSKDSLEHLQRR